MDKYICKECGADVVVGNDGVIERKCDHTGTIILDLHVEVFGESNLQ
jgi:hypothetical protein